MPHRLTVVLSTAIVVVLAVLTGGYPAKAGPAAGNCGTAFIQVGAFRQPGKIDILLQTRLNYPFDHIIAGSAAGWYVNRTTPAFGGLSPQSPNYETDIDEDDWSATWRDVPVGAGYVRIDFPIIEVLTTGGICFGLFPSETVLVPGAPDDRALLTREVALTSKSSSDVVVVVDTTQSMAAALTSLRGRAPEIANALLATSENTRVKVVAFNDGRARVVQDFTTDPAALAAAIGKLRGAGGGDVPEAVLSGLNAAAKSSWRAAATRNVVLLGDAPGKDPEPGTGLTLTRVARDLNTVAFTDAEGARVDVMYQGYLPVDAVDVEGRNPTWFKAVTTATGGTYRTSTSAAFATGVQAVVAAIDSGTAVA